MGWEWSVSLRKAQSASLPRHKGVGVELSSSPSSVTTVPNDLQRRRDASASLERRALVDSCTQAQALSVRGGRSKRIHTTPPPTSKHAKTHMARAREKMQKQNLRHKNCMWLPLRPQPPRSARTPASKSHRERRNAFWRERGAFWRERAPERSSFWREGARAKERAIEERALAPKRER